MAEAVAGVPAHEIQHIERLQGRHGRVHPAGEERLAAVEALMPNDRRFEPLDGDWMRIRSEAR